jgi:hypothetical protein
MEVISRDLRQVFHCLCRPIFFVIHKKGEGDLYQEQQFKAYYEPEMLELVIGGVAEAHDATVEV